MTMDISSRSLHFQFRPSSNLLSYILIIYIIYILYDISRDYFERFERIDQPYSLKSFNAKIIKDLVPEIFKHFSRQSNKNNNFAEICELLEFRFEHVSRTINKQNNKFNMKIVLTVPQKSSKDKKESSNFKSTRYII